MAILPQWFGRKNPSTPSADGSIGADVESEARRGARELVELANLDEDNGDLGSALSRIRDAIRADPGFARAHLNLGNVLSAMGDVDGAIAATLDAIRVDERYAEAHFNLGLLYERRGDPDPAELHFRKALELRPRFAQAAVALAGLLSAGPRISEAEALLRRALEDEPAYAGAAFNLVQLLLGEGRTGEVEQVLRKLIAADPGHVDAYCILGNLCSDQGRAGEADAWYRRAVQFENPGESTGSRMLLARACREVGSLLIDEMRWEEATVHLRRAMALAPEWHEPYVNLAFIELQQARPEVAAELYRTAVRLDPNAPIARSYLLFALNLVDSIGAQELFDEHRGYGDWLDGRIGRKRLAHANTPDASRVLRVGYVSSDYRHHPVMQFVAPMLGTHDPTQVEYFCYSNNGRRRDEYTAELERRFARNWRDITELTDEEACQVIVDDAIDILVDLTGHTGDTRVALFARKPAPVQVTWLGYLNTTGLRTMDYRLVDRHTDPVGQTDQWNTERLIRLPDSQWAYWPMYEAPIMRSARKSGDGRLIFCSFNQYMKVSDRTLDLWARILARLPRAELRIAGVGKGAPEAPFLRRLEQAGIVVDRVQIVRRLHPMRYMQSFDDVDIALDTMPYNGATTTLNALWMGVPIVGLRGERSISRGTYSILKTLGRDDLIAETADQFVELNVRLATDVEWRNSLHESLRDQMRHSPLTDVSRFTENLEAAYREMWREWCASQAGGASS